jgi:hypothetical protein
MKFLIIILFPLLMIGQQKDTLNFHLLSEFAQNKNEHNKIKNSREIYRQISSVGDTLSCYEITKIDSLGNYYTIEVKNTKFIYKILSIKNNEFYPSCNIIEVGKIYQLDLRSLNEKNLRTHIDPNRIGFPLGLRGGSIDYNDEEIYDLYGEYRIKYGLYNEALNLKGLCLIKE